MGGLETRVWPVRNVMFVPYTGVDDGREGGAHPAHYVQLKQIRAFQQLG